MKRFLRPLGLWLASAVLAQAGWVVTSSERENSSQESVEHRKTVLTNDRTGARATLHFVLFHPRQTALRILDQPGSPHPDLAEIMAKEGAIAGVNGGYFDPEDQPVGLLVAGGKKISPQSTARLLSGVLFATADRVEIVRSSRFKMNRKIRNALQCGPLLLERGKTVAGLNASRAARRTFAAVTESGKTAALGSSSSLTLAELGEALALANVAGEQRFVRALNLDGGSSSAFWFGGGADGAFSIGERKAVRDFVALVPADAR